MQYKVVDVRRIFLYSLLLLAFLRSSDIGFAYPSMESQLAFANYTLQKISQALLLLGIITYAVLIPKDFKVSYLPLGVIVIIFCIVISIVFSPYKALSARYFLSGFVVLCPAYLFFKMFGYGEIYRIYKVFMLSLMLACFLYIIIFPQYGIMSGIHSGAYRGVFLHKNTFGFFGVLVSLICLIEYVSMKDFKKKVLYLLLWVFTVFLVIKAKSTTALVLCFLTACIFFGLSFFLVVRSRAARVLGFAICVIGLIIFSFIFSAFYEEIVTSLGKDPTLTGRTRLWEVLLYVGFERPFTGYGLGAFMRPEVMYKYTIEFGWEAKSVHNSFLDVFLGVGLVGLSALLLIIFRLVVSFPIANICDARYRGAITGILVCVVFSFSESGVLLSNTLSWLSLCLFMFGAHRKGLN